MMYHLFFSVGQIQCAVPLNMVRVVLQMVQPGPAPESRPEQAGTVNFHGQIIPVYSVRSFFGLPEQAPRLTDKLIIVEAGHDCIALWVDETHVIELNPSQAATPGNAGNEQILSPGVSITTDGTFIFTDPFRIPGTGKIPLPGPEPGRTDPRRTGSS